MDDFDICVAAFMQDYGFTATYIQSSEGAYDPATGENVVTDVEIPVEVIQLDLPLTRNGTGTATGSLIQDGDKQLFIRPPNKTHVAQPALVVNPAADRVKIGNTVWNITTSKEVVVQGNNQLLIELFIRR